jgi:hypothetical protein
MVMCPTCYEELLYHCRCSHSSQFKIYLFSSQIERELALFRAIMAGYRPYIHVFCKDKEGNENFIGSFQLEVFKMDKFLYRIAATDVELENPDTVTFTLMGVDAIPIARAVQRYQNKSNNVVKMQIAWDIGIPSNKDISIIRLYQIYFHSGEEVKAKP